MQSKVIHIGLGNYVVRNRIVSVVLPSSSPMRRLKEDAKNEGRLIDATQGRRTRSFIITDSNHVILSSVSPETVMQRLESVSEVKHD